MSFTGSLSHIKLQFSQIDVDTLHIATAATLNSEQWTVDSLHMDGSHSCLSYSDHCRIMNLNWEGYENEILHTAY